MTPSTALSCPCYKAKVNRSPTYSPSESSDGSSDKRHPRHRRRRSPTPPSSSPYSSSFDAGAPKAKPKRRGHRRAHPAWKRSRRMEKFKEGGKNVTFLSYDGTYGATDKILGFIQQFDSAFGGEHFDERSKLRHVAMYFQKSARQWWASLRTQGIAPRTWKDCRIAIMMQFLTDEAEDDVLTAWRSLKLEQGETVQKYVDKFWDAHLKATVFKRIEFSEQKQQFCVGLPDDMKAYVNAQKPKTISGIIHHTLVASKIFSSTTKSANQSTQGEKSQSGKPSFFNKGQSDKKKDKGAYRGSNCLSPEEMERYRKENKCFTCGEKGHSYRACPKKTAKKDNPQAAMVLTEDMHDQEQSRLCYAWGKVRDMDSLILFDPGSTHNFISTELAAKLGINEHEMGYAMDAEGAFVGQKVPVTPLIGKLRVHVQGYVDREDFFISPLQHQDVLLGMPWFHRMRAKLSLPDRVISFKHNDKEVSLKVDEKGHTIPIVSQVSIQKSIKSACSAYLIFVKDSSESANSFQSDTSSSSQEEIEQKVFLNEFSDCFTDSIPGELPPSRGEDDHKIDLIPGT